jgi:small GTP-binding protein
MDRKMPVHLVLSYFDTQIGPAIFAEFPQIKNQEIRDFIINFFDIPDSTIFFELKSKHGYFLNFRMSLQSDTARGGAVNALLTVVLTEQCSLYNWKTIMANIVQKITHLHSTFNFLHSKNQNDSETQDHRNKISEILRTEQFIYLEFESSNVYSRLIILGIERVGKTSIISRLKDGIFSPSLRPTLGTQVLNAAIENFRFQIYDVGGQKLLRKKWFQQCYQPEGIIYVIDCSMEAQREQEFIDEYHRVIENYFLKKTREQIVQIPILVLQNKVDLLDSTQLDSEKSKFIKKYTIPALTNPINYFLVSAKTGYGLYESFKWFILQKLM